MELANVYELWDRFDQSNAVEMELELGGMHFHLRADRKEIVRVPDTTADLKEIVRVPDTNADLKEIVRVPDTNADLKEIVRVPDTTKVVKAPLLGTFYAAPSPDAEPFVKPGKEIHKGDVIGIIEAMKLMNEVHAQEDGTVVEILVKDGQMVEYDQVLLSME